MEPWSRRNQFFAFFSFILLFGAGIFALLFVWSAIFKPEDLGTFPLPIVAVLAGVAATFNPCALPTLPACLTRLSAKDNSQRKHPRYSFDTGLGALLVVLILGLTVATLGEGLKPFVRENFRWAQLAIGLTLVTLAGLHMLDRTSRFPILGHIIDRGHQIWEHVLRNPSPGGSLTFGAGFVLVGVGWTGPFLAAVAAFALGTGGFGSSFLAFNLFGTTMGVLVGVVSWLGAASAPLAARTIRQNARRVQAAAATLIIVIGLILIFSSFNPGILDSLILK